MFKQSRKALIEDLRKLGGEWKAELYTFGSYAYHGKVGDDKYYLQAFCHFAPMFDGDDSFESMWHIYKNDKEVGYPTGDPIFQLEEMIKHHSPHGSAD